MRVSGTLIFLEFLSDHHEIWHRGGQWNPNYRKNTEVWLRDRLWLIKGVADKLAKYFSGHLAALWHTFGCNFMGSMHLKLPEKVSRHLVVFSVGRVTSKTKNSIKTGK